MLCCGRSCLDNLSALCVVLCCVVVDHVLDNLSSLCVVEDHVLDKLSLCCGRSCFR